MDPNHGSGIPGWFIALGVIVVLIGIGTTFWRISVARDIAKDAGLDPNTATAVTLLSKDGVDAAYLASTLASRSREDSTASTRHPKTVEQRLAELQALREKGLITQDEHDARRQKILDSI